MEKRREKILLPIDGSPTSDLAVKRSGEYASSSDVIDITLLYVIEDITPIAEVPALPLYQDKEKLAQKVLEKAKKTLNEYGIKCETKIAIGPVADEIIKYAEQNNFEAICIGSRGFGGIKRLVLGSVADRVIRYAHCMVIVVR